MKPSRFLVILLSIGVLFMVTNITPKMGGSPFASAENAVANLEGWTELSATFTYTSADDPSFVLGTSDGDLYYLSPGWRVRLKQGGGYKYFIVTRVTYGGGSTSLTLYGGIDYDLENLEITHFAISNVKAPSGFPLDPEKWTVEVAETDWITKTSPAQSTWYDSGEEIVIPIGAWNVYYTIALDAAKVSSSYADVTVALSTSLSFTTYIMNASIYGYNRVLASISRSNVVSVSSKTTYYIGYLTANVSLDSISIKIQDLRAVCAYL